MLSLSLQEGDIVNGYVLTWHWQTYVDAIGNYQTQIVRSLVYGADHHRRADRAGLPDRVLDRLQRPAAQVHLPVPPAAAVLRLVRAAHHLVAVHPDRRGPAAGAAEGHRACWPASSTCSAPPSAVIAGLIYNFLPFMVLPIYVALERIDPRVIEAARDLYADPVHRVPPGDLPAGPARRLRRRADDLRAGQLRLRQLRPCWAARSTTMIGQVIQAQYLRNSELSDRVGAVVRADGGAADRRLPLRPGARHRGRAEGGGPMTTVADHGGPGRPAPAPGAGACRTAVAGSGCCSSTPGSIIALARACRSPS